MPRKPAPTPSPAESHEEGFGKGYKNVHEAEMRLRAHPLFAPLLLRAPVVRTPGNLCPADGWAVVTSGGQIHVHPTRWGDRASWEYVLAHCLMHLAFGHFGPQDFVHEHGPEWCQTSAPVERLNA